MTIAFVAPVLQRQVVHREMDARQLAAGHRQIAGLAGTASQQDGVVVGAQALHRHVHANVAPRL